MVALGAHPDDIEIGAGGLLLRWRRPPGLRSDYVLVDRRAGSPGRGPRGRGRVPARAPARVDLHDLPDGRLPAHWDEAKEIVEAAARRGGPDLVLAPRPTTRTRTTGCSASSPPRRSADPLVLHYEIPKWDGDLAGRNVYVPLTADRPAAR